MCFSSPFPEGSGSTRCFVRAGGASVHAFRGGRDVRFPGQPLWEGVRLTLEGQGSVKGAAPLLLSDPKAVPTWRGMENQGSAQPSKELRTSHLVPNGQGRTGEVWNALP